jgi:hypothetical protein
MSTRAVPERDVLRAMLDAFKALNILAHRQNTGGFYNSKGQYVAFGQGGNPDITGTMPSWSPWPGVRVECEVKRPGRRPTEAQYRRMREVNDQGGLAFWTDDAGHGFRCLQLLLSGYRVRINDRGEPEFYRPEREEGGPRSSSCPDIVTNASSSSCPTDGASS